MIKLTKTLVLVLVASLTLFMTSCERPITDIPEDHTTVAGEIEAGWLAYAGGDFDIALEHFTTAALRNAAELGAYNGLAWSYLHLGSYNTALSQFSFVKNLALEQNDTALLADSYAGVALIYENLRYAGELSGEETDLLNEYADASIEAANTALEIASDYSTTHDPALDAAVLNDVVANSYFYLHWYGNALTHLIGGGDLTMADLNTVTISPYTVDFQIYPVLDDETGAMTLEPVTIEWTSAENYVDGAAVTGIFSISGLTDANDGAATADINVMNGTTVHFDESNEFASHTETIETMQISYPLDDGAAIPITLLKLSKGGIYDITSIQIHAENYLENYNADGTISTDTVMVQLDYEGAKEIFRFGDGYPAEINPAFGSDFMYNYVYLADLNAVGVTFDITYSYAYYTGTFTVTDNFNALLAKVSSYLN